MRSGFGGALFEFGGHGEGGLDGQRREVSSSSCAMRSSRSAPGMQAQIRWALAIGRQFPGRR
jgi:hypothetical protein